MGIQEIVQDYPELSEEEIRQATAYGAWLASEQCRSYPSQNVRYLAEMSWKEYSPQSKLTFRTGLVLWLKHPVSVFAGFPCREL